MGHAGIVIGLEVSRLARSCSDWHKLLEICGLTGTLIMDEDGLYDPTLFNDRLVLGLKGTMSEAELHALRARLRGGMLNKARRGELVLRLPVGFVRDGIGRVVLWTRINRSGRQLVLSLTLFRNWVQPRVPSGPFVCKTSSSPSVFTAAPTKANLPGGPLTTSPFPITISTTPGTPVLTAVSINVEARARRSTVFPGGPLAIEGDAIDTSGTSIVFTPITAVGGVLTSRSSRQLVVLRVGCARTKSLTLLRFLLSARRLDSRRACGASRSARQCRVSQTLSATRSSSRCRTRSGRSRGSFDVAAGRGRAPRPAVLFCTPRSE